VRSNTVRLELPRGSGRFVEVPEVDDARWVGVDEARELLVAGQVAAVDALVALVAGP
jgi:predicted NUDIX family NTP pyrophosphohydrolase